MQLWHLPAPINLEAGSKICLSVPPGARQQREIHTHSSRVCDSICKYFKVLLYTQVTFKTFADMKYISFFICLSK